ncbi:hypothetical protein PIB30_021660 [Stylosanthes scabra]|uniref:Zinc finger GRF-type domain-containing protein n=1 Tax=Stylosanthes scabra TaxID=79078 RepID=A0ABU6Y7A5_9FABA|nr:hypothetical protein [Stylosanthes scabra]
MGSESWRGSRSSWSTGSMQKKLLCYHGVKEQCGFFEWANKLQAKEDSEKARIRKKVSSLKTRLRACEMRLKIAVFVEFRWKTSSSMAAVNLV